MKPPTPLIYRVYTVVGEPGREVVLTIGKPRPWHGDWACRVRIYGIPKGRDLVPGIDPLQAVQLAILSARRLLDASGLPLLWMTDGAPGDVGIPLSVPTGHGFAFQRKMERHIEREDKRFTEAVAAFLKEKERRRAAKRSAQPGEPEQGPAAPRSCSFCGKTEAETKLCAGLAGNICVSCTRLACGVLGIPTEK